MLPWLYVPAGLDVGAARKDYHRKDERHNAACNDTGDTHARSEERVKVSWTCGTEERWCAVMIRCMTGNVMEMLQRQHREGCVADSMTYCCQVDQLK